MFNVDNVDTFSDMSSNLSCSYIATSRDLSVEKCDITVY